MSNFCINCGESGTLEVLPVPDKQEAPFLQKGEYIDDKYSEEHYVTILKCTACSHEMIDLDS